MAPLPPYVTGSTDRRTFTIDGHDFFVYRSRSTREFGFMGIGRDGDYAPDDAPEFAILDPLAAELPGITRGYGPSYSAASEDALAGAERALVRRTGGYASISREVVQGGPPGVGAALLALPMEPGLVRRYYLCGGHALDVVVPVDGDATANEWQWGEDPGDWLPTVLAELGEPPVRIGGLDVGKQYRVPRALLPALLARALEHFGSTDVRLYDAR